MSRVLVAEDSETILLLMRRRLEMAGHEVITAKDGARAVEMFEGSGGERPDIVLLDAMMPRMAGAEALERIRRFDREVPVLIVSAHWELAGSPEWEQADGYVTKPIEFEDLLARIESLTAGD